MTETLTRTAFTTSRLLEFFTEKELSMQLGHSREYWPIALLKELIDNALDACEVAGVPPQIGITIEPDALSVRDNAGGLPVSVLEKSLDYAIRVSDKNHYVSPTRGQLGNALKCVWAAPFVKNGEHGLVEVITGGMVHRIDVTLDRIAQKPHIEHTTSPDGLVKNGTLVKMHWPGIAGYLGINQNPYFYKMSAVELVSAYTMFNPHALFVFSSPEFDKKSIDRPTSKDWRKWTPNDPTSPHWYTPDKLRALIAAYVSAELEGERALTVREFVSEFRGLSSTAKQKKVTDWMGLSGAYLHDLVVGDDIDPRMAGALLSTMQRESRPVKPQLLGIIGEQHITYHLSGSYNEPESIRYKMIKGTADGLPFVLEVAFGVYTAEYSDNRGDRFVGLNWSPAIRSPMGELNRIFSEMRVDSFDPVNVVVHLACPRLEFTDRGKSRLDLPGEINEALEKAVQYVAQDWKAAKRKADQDDRVRQRDLEKMRKRQKRREWNIKDAAWHVMKVAYLDASSNGTLPANARQIMYSARPLVLELTGGKCWKNSSYFTQHLLPDYIDENPDETENWDVVFDARGKLVEPHTNERVDLGGLAVRRYVDGWHDEIGEDIQEFNLDHLIETAGPTNRYKFALFVEKEGFNELFNSVRLVDRYDLALMSTKGMSVTAARALVERLSENGVTILVLHDFDAAGITILGTLRGDTRRWQYRTTPNIIDLGFRLADVQANDLQSESVFYNSKVDPRQKLREYDASLEECNFLVQAGRPRNWRGERVELNAMPSGRFISWLEKKLEFYGCTKLIPDEETLKMAYQRSLKLAALQNAIDTTIESFGELPAVPEDLQGKITEWLKVHPSSSWDDAVYHLARMRQQ